MTSRKKRKTQKTCLRKSNILHNENTEKQRQQVANQLVETENTTITISQIEVLCRTQKAKNDTWFMSNQDGAEKKKRKTKNEEPTKNDRILKQQKTHLLIYAIKKRKNYINRAD